MLTQRVSLTNQDARQVSATQLHALGTICETADGRSFRYSGSGAVALAAGLVNVTPAKVANHTNIAVAVAAAVGAKTVSVTLGATAATQDQYRDGYLVVNDAAGVGSAYRISGNPAIASSGTGVIALAETVATALTTASKVSLVPSPWSNTIVHPGGASTFYAAGVPNVAVAASSFFWAQTSGIASVLSDGVIAKGTNGILTAAAVPGAVVTQGGATVTQTVSVAVEATVDTKYYPQFLTLE
jgi:hypothetical protein